MNDKPSWRDDFDEQFPGMLSEATDDGGYNARPYIKSFIQFLLDQKAKEIEGKKKESGNETWVIDAYNQALDDALTILKGEEV